MAELNGSVPQPLRWIGPFIERVGFPVAVAVVLMGAVGWYVRADIASTREEHASITVAIRQQIAEARQLRCLLALQSEERRQASLRHPMGPCGYLGIDVMSGRDG